MNRVNKCDVKLGDLIWVKLHGDGHVQKGTRPAVVVQNNVGNYYSPTIQIFPLTSRCSKSHLPTHVKIPAGVAGLTKDSIVQCESMRTIDKMDILGYMGHLPDHYMKQISVASTISIPLIQYLSIEQPRILHAQIS